MEHGVGAIGAVVCVWEVVGEDRGRWCMGFLEEHYVDGAEGEEGRKTVGLGVEGTIASP